MSVGRTKTVMLTRVQCEWLYQVAHAEFMRAPRGTGEERRAFLMRSLLFAADVDVLTSPKQAAEWAREAPSLFDMADAP